jgi:hypothetical protein
VITRTSVPVPFGDGGNSWNGVWVQKGAFKDRFDVKSTEFNEELNLYTVTVEFKKTPDKEYTFEIDADKYSTDKQTLATEILRQLQNN